MDKFLRRSGVFFSALTVFAAANAVTALADPSAILSRASAAGQDYVNSPSGTGQDAHRSFAEWIAELKDEARKKRIGERTLAAALNGLRLNRRTLALESRQPEFATPVGAYVAAQTTKEALDAGREKRRLHADLLGRIERSYGVPARYILAIWRLESNFGANFGAFPVVETLATLAYAGTAKRRPFWRRQLFGALQIVDRGHAPLGRLVGSWAGAMGHTQFIPTTYLAHAVDFDGDGRRDLWRSLPDVFASTANYLNKVRLAAGTAVRLGGDAAFRVRLQPGPYRGKQDRGGMAGAGRPSRRRRAAFRNEYRKVSLIVPAGWNGPIFLVTDNYRAILRYNNAAAYALTVGLLAERLEGRGRLAVRWPSGDRLLTRAEKTELQQRLTALGYDPGPVDGKVGLETRKAIRAFQKKAGRPADGYANHALLEAVRKAALSLNGGVRREQTVHPWCRRPSDC